VARAGIQPLDADVGKWLRKLAPHVRVKVLLNKSEGFHDDSSGALMAAMGEAHSLGFGAPVAVSAETGQGLLELYGDLRPWVERAQEELLAKRAGILLLIFPFLQFISRSADVQSKVDFQFM
jgi:predicted GTPase